jgi:heat shock protein HtpX
MLFFGSRRARVRVGGDRGRGGGGAVILILVAVAIFILVRFLAIALRFALSRKREFLADAGAVELTKNADAMISALRRIEGRSEIEAPSQIRPMFIDLPRASGFAGLFATHPPIEDRVRALVDHAGGHDLPLPDVVPARRQDDSAGNGSGGPWG